MKEDLIKALLKKAKGYEAKEVVDEFVMDDGNRPILNKRKVTYKEVPPDINAVKAIAELTLEKDYKDYTPDELVKEKTRLLRELKDLDKKSENRRKKNDDDRN